MSAAAGGARVGGRRIVAVPAGTRLDAERRLRDTERLKSGVDVLVIGGGITGVGVALDAAARGLDTVLVEAHDLAFGTSRWSSKLVHGGLRYLAKGDVGVAWESARERAVLGGTVAAHLVRAMPQVVPHFSDDPTPARLALVGFRAGDVLKAAARTPRGLLPNARHVDPGTAKKLVPGLRTTRLRGAAVGWDFQLTDDARLVVAVARTAAGLGAGVLTQTRVTSVDPITGDVAMRDGITDERLHTRARWVVNATGVWAGDLDPGIELHPSLGSHIIIPTASLGGGRGSLTVPVPGHTGRFVFSLPQPDGLSYVGVTDTPMSGPIPEVPTAPESDIEWILDVLSAPLERPVTRGDVLGTYAGVRPLIGLASSSADISRKHLIRAHGRLITVTGGKLTTYRRMAQDTVDLLSSRPCPTRDLPLVGAPAGTGIDPGIPTRLWQRYGSEAPAVWALGDDDTALREPIAPGSPVLGVELLFGVLAEGALSAADLLQRRTRVGLTAVPRSALAAAELALTRRG